MQIIYAAVISMKCNGDYYVEVLDKDVKVTKQMKALSSDVLKPRYHVMYILMSSKPKTVKYVYDGETSEQEKR